MTVKECGCCRAIYSLERFLELPPAAGGCVGDDGVEVCEYRNCDCGTTLAIVSWCHLGAREILEAERERDAA